MLERNMVKAQEKTINCLERERDCKKKNFSELKNIKKDNYCYDSLDLRLKF